MTEDEAEITQPGSGQARVSLSPLPDFIKSGLLSYLLPSLCDGPETNTPDSLTAGGLGDPRACKAVLLGVILAGPLDLASTPMRLFCPPPQNNED